MSSFPNYNGCWCITRRRHCPHPNPRKQRTVLLTIQFASIFISGSRMDIQRCKQMWKAVSISAWAAIQKNSRRSAALPSPTLIELTWKDLTIAQACHPTQKWHRRMPQKLRLRTNTLDILTQVGSSAIPEGRTWEPGPLSGRRSALPLPAFQWPLVVYEIYLPSRDIPTSMHFFSRQYWQRFRLILWIVHCWFLVHGRYCIFCWMDRRKKPYIRKQHHYNNHIRSLIS